MLLFTTIFVFYKLTILQGNYAEKISGPLDMTFSCKQNRNSKWCLFAILLILIWGFKKTTQQNKRALIVEAFNVKPVCNSFKIKHYFLYKDPIPNDLKSFLVYRFTCASCHSSYIGETCGHFKTRIEEHIKKG